MIAVSVYYSMPQLGVGMFGAGQEWHPGYLRGASTNDVGFQFWQCSRMLRC